MFYNCNFPGSPELDEGGHNGEEPRGRVGGGGGRGRRGAMAALRCCINQGQFQSAGVSLKCPSCTALGSIDLL